MQGVTEEYAGFGRRTVAALLDMIIFSFVFSMAHVLVFGGNGMQLVMESGVLQVKSESGWGMLEQGLIVAVTLIMWIKFLGTPGKLILGCQVLDAKTKQPIKPLQAVIRYLSYFVSIIPLGLGMFWILWDKKKQGFHDKLAGTVVVVDSMHLKQNGSQDESQKTIHQLLAELR